MKYIKNEELIKLSDIIYELEQINALIGFMQTAFAEGSSIVNEEDTSNALYYIYINQYNKIKQMEKIINGEEQEAK